MAENLDMRLNYVLCFLFTKLNKCDEKQIVTSIMDYYTSADIHEAKELFVNIVSTLSGIDSLSKIRDRRGESREKHELEDIFTIITELDEKKVLHSLPKFVSDSADEMPSSAIVDGDVRAIMNKFGKMESQIQLLQNTVNKLSAAMSCTGAIVPGLPQSKVLSSDPHTAGNSRPAASQPGRQQQQDDFMNGQYLLQQQRIWADEYTSSSSCDEMMTDQHDAGDWQTSTGRRRNKRARVRSDQQQAVVGSLPAELRFDASSVQPSVQPLAPPPGFHVATAQSATDHQSTAPSSRQHERQQTDTAPNKFVVAQPAATAVAGYSGYAAAAAKPADSQPRPPSRRPPPQRKQVPAVVGRSRKNMSNEATASHVGLVAAAKPYISKATFCIDNVTTDVTEWRWRNSLQRWILTC